ncbi:MAG TPA: ABC transporter permease [Rhodanobacteraceae bacterium]|nr:ABC transporter permease [Rhodanobacteraceae bacterium]
METALTMPRPRAIRAYLLEARYEFLRLLRTPSFALPTILFPSMFYLLFGVLLSSSMHGIGASKYLLATYTVFGVMAPGLFGFGVVVAMEREQGLLTLKRALPMPPGAYLFAKMAMAMLFAALITLLLMALAAGLGHVRMPLQNWLGLFGVDILGVLPFCALGLFVGTLVAGQGAPAVVNLIYLPMSFLSGLWIPLPILPKFLQQISPLWPSTHLGQIALSASGIGGDGRVVLHAAVLAGFTLVFFLIARRWLARMG